MRIGIKSAILGASLAIWSYAANAQAVASPVIAPEATQAYLHNAHEKQVWSDRNFKALVLGIEGLEKHGLTPEHYGLSALKSTSGNAAVRDELATQAWLAAAAHLLYGKVDAVSVEPDWTVAKRSADIPAVLRYALMSGKVTDSLESFAPIQPGYAALKTELARLKTQKATAQTIIPEGATLKPTMTGTRVTALQKRLSELGYIPATAVNGTFDDPTKLAVQTFQTANFLDDDGVVGAATLRLLNRGVDDQIAQVRVNLERWRWLPGDLGRRHLRANIAGFEVTAYENGVPQRTHLTIVGKTYRKTPVFSDEIEYAIFNPWWEVPPSLARSDKLPLFQRDAGAPARLGFHAHNSSGAEVPIASIDWKSLSASSFPYRLRQQPGPQNALGLVKIMFPNPHNVYLHDTPTRDLFAQRQRAFSSGCLRTQNPVDLAKWLLSETPEWTPARVDAAVTSGKETRATLSQKVPVHILYSTVVPDGAGGVRYLDDIYLRDGRVLEALNRAPAVISKSR